MSTTVLSVRVSQEERAILEAASEQAHTSLSDFVRRKAVDAAECDMLERRVVLSLRLEGLNFPRLMSDCREIAFSAGSACGSGTGAPSRVLTAIGLDAKTARSSIRLGFGRYTTRDEVEIACRAIEAGAAAQGV